MDGATRKLSGAQVPTNVNEKEAVFEKGLCGSMCTAMESQSSSTKQL